MEAGLTERARNTAWRLLDRARTRGWADVDPYDGLAGWADRLLPPQAVLPRRLVIQGVMRSPGGLRSLLGVSPRREPYSLGVLLSVAVMVGDREAQRNLMEVLLETRLLDHGAWGYTFPVVTRAARYGPDSPNVISTSFVALGLLDLLERDPGTEWAQPALRGAVDWLVGEAWEPEMAGFRYHPGNPHLIFNASALASCVVARAEKALGLQHGDVVETALRRVMAAQRPDGSWLYGDAPHLGWVDNHHTGFVLKSLLLLPIQTRPDGWRSVVIKGLRFYLHRLIDVDGAPKATPERRYPLDSLAAGQAVETLALAAQVLGSSDYLGSSGRVFQWAERHLRRRDGRYRFRRGRFLPWPGAYLRWGEVHVALGAARLATDSNGGEECQ